MKYVIVLAQSGEPTVKETESLEVTDVQDVVGGEFEQMPSPPEVTVLAIADPRSEDHYNWSATRLCQQYLMPTDRIFGTALITGPADPLGDPTDVPEYTLQTLQEWYEHRR